VYVHACAIGTPRVLADDDQTAVAAALATYGHTVAAQSS
ncbi:MAG: hypothetical protein QOF76_3683, partial [Solirubrobacteraceae bacterium]|nr:hypothetical protein [Solirubrobacteraceae bacterium]